jgi:hypothetical protein
MKNIRHELDDSLRPEYRRSDFGEMIQGKYATTEIELAELVRLLLACIGEDEGVTFIRNDSGHKPGDWTYEVDDANQITLRYWNNEFDSVEEVIQSSPGVGRPQERAELQDLLLHHVNNLKEKANSCKS